MTNLPEGVILEGEKRKVFCYLDYKNNLCFIKPRSKKEYDKIKKKELNKLFKIRWFQRR